ncbi:hypothetical protein JTB14_036799 [Gonioctena quinquepunctata]|nr:hypothetical protein JTB14_036799 [Gonioctena quinquepunctata]
MNCEEENPRNRKATVSYLCLRKHEWRAMSKKTQNTKAINRKLQNLQFKPAIMNTKEFKINVETATDYSQYIMKILEVCNKRKRIFNTKTSTEVQKGITPQAAQIMCVFVLDS